MIIDQITELVNNLRRKELYLIHDNTVIMLTAELFQKVLCKLAGFLQTDARFYDLRTVSVLTFRFEQNDLLALLDIVIPYHQRIGSLGAAHRTISENQFCHFFYSSSPSCMASYRSASFLLATDAGSRIPRTRPIKVTLSYSVNVIVS
ncbi:MAG: hypothetical protein BWZ04_03233 [Firmicutes bacterium ADurb.BinA205]|nr:MAG: hypothetical protein BWZ04_03233 [Firmicutes bacterium ADurb.BinA205]